MPEWPPRNSWLAVGFWSRPKRANWQPGDALVHCCAEGSFEHCEETGREAGRYSRRVAPRAVRWERASAQEDKPFSRASMRISLRAWSRHYWHECNSAVCCSPAACIKCQQVTTHEPHFQARTFQQPLLNESCVLFFDTFGELFLGSIIGTDSSASATTHPRNNHAKVVEYLLHKRANVNGCTADGYSPTYIAVHKGCEQALPVLLQAPGVDPDLRDLWDAYLRDLTGWVASCSPSSSFSCSCSNPQVAHPNSQKLKTSVTVMWGEGARFAMW